MATHFAQQRPCQGMAGFKFRTRTKSKYDRPQPQNLFEQMAKQLSKDKRGRSTDASKSKSKAKGEQQLEKQIQQNISTEDVKKFFMQLSDSGQELMQQKYSNQINAKFTYENLTQHHRSPLKDAIDFKKDMTKLKQATLNHRAVLEQVAQMRLRLLVEGAYTGKQNLEVKQPSLPELPISTEQFSAIAQSGEFSHAMLSNMHGLKSPDSRKTLKSGIPVIESHKQLLTKSVASATIDNIAKLAQDNLNSRQKLRLSAEGLLDIVTEQFLDTGFGPKGEEPVTATNATLALPNSNKGVEKLKRQQSEAKVIMTILTPILTENSDNAKDKHHYSSPNGGDLATRVDKKQSAAQPSTKRTGETIQAGQSNLLSPDMQHLLSKKSSLTKKEGSQNTPTSKLSRGSGTSVKRAVFSKRTSMSQENLMSMTPRVIEPRCDNEDLRMISETHKDTEENEFGSKMVHKGDDSDTGRRVVDLNIGVIEMKLTRHGVKEPKRRLKSAGPRRFQNTTQTISGYNSLVPNVNHSGRYAAAKIRTNASGEHIPVQTLVTAKQNATEQSTARIETQQASGSCAPPDETKHQYFKIQEPVGQDESWVQDLKLKTEGLPESHTRTYKQLNTLMLSDQSKQSKQVPQMMQSPPSVGQLQKADASGQSPQPFIKMDSNNTMQTGSEVLVQDTSDRCKLQNLIEDEIKKIKQTMTGERGRTPQIAFVDQSQLVQRGFQRSPQRSLKFLEDTMKQHFKYGLSTEAINTIARPILSTRQMYQSVLQQHAQEQKVLETLKSNNEKDKYDEFKNAQQVAATMMEMVRSSTVKQNNSDLIFDPNDCGALTMTREQLLMDGAQTLENFGTTLDNNLNLSQTAKSSRKPSQLQNQISPETSVAAEKQGLDPKNMIILVKPAQFAMNTSGPNSYNDVESKNAQDTMASRPYIVPAKLDIALQENVSNNIATNNKKIVANRVKMAERRNSRPDTLNQLVSPREHFEKTHRAYQQNGPLGVLGISAQEQQLKQIQQPRTNCVSPNANLTSCNSVNSYDRKVHMHAQGGGFNRSPCSGYFKGKRKSSILQQSILHQQQQSQQYELTPTCASPQRLELTQIKKKLEQIETTTIEECEKPKKAAAMRPKPVVVEERPQILANEIWTSQTRGMPLKVVFQVQKPASVERKKFVKKQQNQRDERSISPSRAHGDFLAESIAPVSARGEAKIEVFPFPHQKQIASAKTQQKDPINTEYLNVLPEETNKQVLSSGTLAESSSMRTHAHPNQVTAVEPFDGGPLTPNDQVPFLFAINEQFSEGQQTASNQAIVEFRYSNGEQQTNSKKTQGEIPNSTVHLRGSYTAMDGPSDLVSSKANLGNLDEPDQDQNLRPQQSRKRIRDSSARLSQELINQRGNNRRILNSHDGSMPLLIKEPPHAAENSAIEERKEADEVEPVTQQIEVSADIMKRRRSSEIKQLSQEKTANFSSYDNQTHTPRDSTILKPKAEVIATTSAYLDQSDVDVVRISDLKQQNQINTQLQLDNNNNYNYSNGHQVVVSTPSCEAYGENLGPRRRSVLQKAIMKAPEYRVQLSPNSCGQVLVQDLREEDQQPFSEVIDSDTAEDCTPRLVFQGQTLTDAIGDMTNTYQTQQTHQHPLTQEQSQPSNQFTVVENALSTEQNSSNNNTTNQRLTRAMWQPSVTTTRGKASVSIIRSQRPKTTNPSQRAADPNQCFIQNSAASQQPPRQTVSYKNVSMNLSSKSAVVTGEPSPTAKQSIQALSNINNSDLYPVAQNGRTKQAPDYTQLKSKKRPEPHKARTAKLTFTQGVSQLIRKFDKKFIVENFALPQPAPQSSIDLFQSQSKQIVERKAYMSERIANLAGKATSRDNFITANITNHLKTVSSIKETATRTLTIDDQAPRKNVSPQPNSTTAAVKSSALLRFEQLTHSKSKPAHATCNNVPRSPIVQKTFDADAGLNKVQPTVSSSMHHPSGPIFNAVAANLNISPSRSVNQAQSATYKKTKQHTTLGGERASLNSQTTIATLHQNNARRSTLPASPATAISRETRNGVLSSGETAQQQRRWSLNQQQQQSHLHRRVNSLKQHPLEFLAQAAVESTQDMISSRNDGLIIHDHRKYQDKTEYALSVSAQNLVDNIKCAKVTSKPPIGGRRRTIRHQRGGTMIMGQQEVVDKRASLPDLISQLPQHKTLHDECNAASQQHHAHNHLNSTINAQSTQSMPFPHRSGVDKDTGYASMAASTHSLVSGCVEQSNQNLDYNDQLPTNTPQHLVQSASMSVTSYAGGPAVQRSTLRRFHQNALQGQMPPHVLQKYSKRMQTRLKSGSGSVASSGRLSLTQNDIQAMFNDLKKVQQKQLNQSTVVLRGTQVNQYRTNPIINTTPRTMATNRVSKNFVSQSSQQRVSQKFKRRAMSSNLHGAAAAKFKAGETLQRRDSLLFKQTVIEGTQI